MKAFLCLLEVFYEAKRLLGEILNFLSSFGIIAAVGSVEQRNHVKFLLFHDVSLVAECLESVKSVVVAGAAHADASKRQAQIFNLDNRIVDAGGAGGGFGQESVHLFAMVSEDVEGERLRSLLNEFYCIINFLVADDWKNGAEDFGLHNLHAAIDVCENCRRCVAAFFVAFASENLCGAFAYGVFDERLVALDRFRINDVDKVFAFVSGFFCCAVHLLDFCCDCFGKFLY